MADVRSLLRAERASRRIEHPYASYTKSGTLTCTTCDLAIRADSLWDLHIKSAPHVRNARRPKGEESSQDKASAPLSKKRKAETDDEEDQRKRTKPEAGRGLPAGFFDNRPQGDGGLEDVSTGEPGQVSQTNENSAEPVMDAVQVTRSPPGPVPQSAAAPQPPQTEAVDEDEWAAFERDVATPPPEQPAVSAFNATATIEAAPMSAADLAAQAREDQSTQRGRREAELEAEKEDAARHLEEELDELEGLEERVKKMRKKREELQRRRAVEAAKAEADTVIPEVSKEESGDDSDEEEDDFDDWGFGA